MPVHIGIQWPSREAALGCPRGDLSLCCCPECGYIFNQAFDPDRLSYSQDYDNSLHYSPTFQRYTHRIARRLTKRYDLHGKQIVEVGCGKGEFLLLLARLGGNRGIGFDPSYEPNRSDAAMDDNVTFVQDFYTEDYAYYRADLLCSRYVLEHLPDPVGFLRMINRALRPPSGTVLYFEVPNVSLILHRMSVWDVIYEHCSYFSTPSLARAFEEAGFEVADVYSGYDNQFLSIEARHVAAPSSPSHWRSRSAVLALQHQAQTLEATLRSLRTAWTDQLRTHQAAGHRVVVWGAGAKAVSFLNVIGMNEAVEAVVDINPHKQGAFLPGTGHLIVAPDYLLQHPPEKVVLMNPIYENEVRATLHDLGLAPEIAVAF